MRLVRFPSVARDCPRINLQCSKALLWCFCSSAQTLKSQTLAAIPLFGHRNTAHTNTDRGWHCSCSCCVLPGYSDLNFPQGMMILSNLLLSKPGHPKEKASISLCPRSYRVTATAVADCWPCMCCGGFIYWSYSFVQPVVVYSVTSVTV